MSLRLLTASGGLTLGDPPPTALRCYCGAPAQLVAGPDDAMVGACAPCAEQLIVMAGFAQSSADAHLQDRPAEMP